MRKSKIKKNRRRLFVIGAYWILLVGMLGIFASPIFKYSASETETIVGNIQPSILVVEKGSKEGVANKFVSMSLTTEKNPAFTTYKFANGKTGEEGYSNEGSFSLLKKGTNYYLDPDHRLSETGYIVKSISFYLTDSAYSKVGKQVVLETYPFATSEKDLKEKYITKGSSSTRLDFWLPTIELYSDGSGGKILTAAEAESAAKTSAAVQPATTSATTATPATDSSVGVGVSIPTPNNSDLNGKTSYTYDQYICALYYWALNIGFGLTLLMIVYAGYRYMTAAGNDSVFTETKDVLTSAILGFTMLLCIRLVLHVLGVKEPSKCFTEAIELIRTIV